MIEILIAAAAGIVGTIGLHRCARTSRYELVRKADAVIFGGGGPGEEH